MRPPQNGRSVLQHEARSFSRFGKETIRLCARQRAPRHFNSGNGNLFPTMAADNHGGFPKTFLLKRPVRFRHGWNKGGVASVPPIAPCDPRPPKPAPGHAPTDGPRPQGSSGGGCPRSPCPASHSTTPATLHKTKFLVKLAIQVNQVRDGTLVRLRVDGQGNHSSGKDRRFLHSPHAPFGKEMPSTTKGLLQKPSHPDISLCVLQSIRSPESDTAWAR